MAQWEYGRDIDYLTHKSKQVCRQKHKPSGRNWVCQRCGFRGHRDLVGSVNMHFDAFGVHLKFPRSADVSPSWQCQVKE